MNSISDNRVSRTIGSRSMCASSGAWSWRARALGAIVLAVLAGHGLSLWHGYSFDDHTHRQALREAGWNLSDLVQAARVGEANGMVQFWWGEERTFWQPFRPLCFLAMKVEYSLVGWGGGGMHAFCLGWHVGCAVMVVALAVRVLGDRRWALAAGLLFALHPGHGTTSEWVAGSNEVMASFFILGSLLLYGRFSGWVTPMIGQPGRSASPAGLGGGGAVFLVLSLLGFAVALGCRETAVVVPVLAVMLDLLAGGSHVRKRLGSYACYAAITLGYLWFRHRSLGGVPAPGLPYMYPPSEPGFLRFVLDKLLFYQLGLYVYIPALQLGPFEFFQRHPAILYGLSGGTLGVLVLMTFRTVGSNRPIWAFVVWPMICVGPVLAVFAGSHHLYLPSAGSSILLMAILMRFGRMGRSVIWERARVPILVTGLVGYLGGSVVTGVQFQRLSRIEQALAEELVGAVGPAGDGDHVFAIDFPLLACFTGPVLAEATGAAQLTIYALSVRGTGGPDAEIVAFGESSIQIRFPAKGGGQKSGSLGIGAYFAEMAERQIRLLIPATAGLRELPPVGTELVGVAFTARLMERGEGGSSEWLLEFAEPLASAGYHFIRGLPDGQIERLGPPFGGLESERSAQRVAPANG